jgi:hypothetical protein
MAGRTSDWKGELESFLEPFSIGPSISIVFSRWRSGLSAGDTINATTLSRPGSSGLTLTLASLV